MNIEEKIMTYVKKEIAPGRQLDAKTSLVEIIDSTGIMELVVWIETEFGFSVEIDAVTPENFGDVALISQYVASQVKKAS
jgi:acyl carrier protein